MIKLIGNHPFGMACGLAICAKHELSRGRNWRDAVAEPATPARRFLVISCDATEVYAVDRCGPEGRLEGTARGEARE